MLVQMCRHIYHMTVRAENTEGIKITIKMEEDGTLPFSDVSVQHTNSSRLSHSVYRKKTGTDR